jgi:gamma-glutamylcyclotransferase (GGCT)/AIG2-like uncharacterized protein YtfP
MNQYLFSYGTLQKKEVQLALFGRILQGSMDNLRGYKISTIEINDETFLARGEQKLQATAIISINENDRIQGMVFEVTEDELLTADRYEPAGYERVEVVLDSGKKSWIYIAVETI